VNRLSPSVIILLAWLVVAIPASAHAHLQSSIPSDQARLSAAPAALTLDFSESARLTVLSLTRSGHLIPVTLNHDAKASSRIVVPLPALKPGTYEVQWRVIAEDDGHVTHGSFRFTIAEFTPG
jgi:methionine-rich copper-binding protein CopC